MRFSMLLLFGAGCTSVSTTSPPEDPVDTDVSEDTDAADTAEPDLPPEDTDDTGWPDADGNCLTSAMVQAIGYTSTFADLDSVEQAAGGSCISSWRCTTAPERRGFAQDISECVAGGYFDDGGGLVATWHSDDGGGHCQVNWTGAVIDDCPQPADAQLSAGCVVGLGGPGTPSLDANPPFGPADPAQLMAQHACHGQASCEVDGVQLSLYSVRGVQVPDVFVYDGQQLVAEGDAYLWRGPEAMAACLDVVPTPSDACGLVP